MIFQYQLRGDAASPQQREPSIRIRLQATPQSFSAGGVGAVELAVGVGGAGSLRHGGPNRGIPARSRSGADPATARPWPDPAATAAADRMLTVQRHLADVSLAFRAPSRASVPGSLEVCAKPSTAEPFAPVLECAYPHRPRAGYSAHRSAAALSRRIFPTETAAEAPKPSLLMDGRARPTSTPA